MLAIAGAAVDVAALNTAFKSARALADAGKEFNRTNDLALLEKRLNEIKELDQRIKNNISKKANIEKQETEFVKSQVKLRTMHFATLPGLIQSGEFLMHAVFAIRKGIVDLDTLLARIVKKNRLSSVNLSDADRKLAEQSFEKAKELTNLEGELAKELNEALLKEDFAKLKELVGEEKALMEEYDEAGKITNITKTESPIWKNLSNAKGGRKTSGTGRNKQYYEWDHTHNDIEVYDSKGLHLGSMDPKTGKMYKPPVNGRTINL